MNALAIETSARHGSIALAIDGVLLSQHHLPPEQRHATGLMPAIDTLTKAAGWSPRDIHHLYLSIGPGSFTGLRIAIAAARAIAHATGAKLVAVPSLDIIAHNAPPEATRIIPLLDAKRGQVFTALYTRNADGVLTQTLPAQLVTPAEILARARALAPHTPLTLLGEGLGYHEIPAAPDLTLLPEKYWFPQAATLLTLAHQKAQRGDFTAPQDLLPLYIRLPEAEEVWQKKHARATPSP